MFIDIWALVFIKLVWLWLCHSRLSCLKSTLAFGSLLKWYFATFQRPKAASSLLHLLPEAWSCPWGQCDPVRHCNQIEVILSVFWAFYVYLELRRIECLNSVDYKWEKWKKKKKKITDIYSAFQKRTNFCNYVQHQDGKILPIILGLHYFLWH